MDKPLHPPRHTAGVFGTFHALPNLGETAFYRLGTPQLMVVPAFLAGQPSVVPNETEIAAAFDLTSYFLRRHVYEPRAIKEPDARAGFVAAVRRAIANAGEKTQ